jgi:glycosyltransferase involved in cell wall biosynthesis
MKMCEAFSNDFDEVTLYAYSEEKSIEGVYEFYGVKNSFLIKLYPYKKNRVNRILNSISTLLKLSKKNKNRTAIYCREIFSAFFASIFRYKNVFEIHNLPSRKLQFLVNYIFKSKTNLLNVTISNSLKNKLEELYNPKNPIYAFHDGASILNESFKNPPKFYNESDFNIGYVGHLYKGRGIELIIELAKRLPDFSFQIVGGEKSDLDRLKNSSPKNVFYHGFVAPKDTSKYRFFSDILLMPYKKGLASEGSKADTSPWMSPMKLFEYMSSSKPIISTDLPVLREVLNDKNSILVPYDVVYWEKAILKIFNNRQFGKLLSTNSYNDLMSKFTWKKRSNNISNLIKRKIK